MHHESRLLVLIVSLQEGLKRSDNHHSQSSNAATLSLVEGIGMQKVNLHGVTTHKSIASYGSLGR